MDQKDFPIFCTLFSEVHAKAFGEPLTKLPHGKAQTLSWLLFEATGELLSYKSLANYAAAILEGKSGKINPTGITLSILAQYVTGQSRVSVHGIDWFRYRSSVLMQA